MNKPRFTILQQEILRYLFMKSGMTFNARSLAKPLKVSPTAISKSLKGLEGEGLIIVTKDRESKRLSIELDKNNPKVFMLKRVENLRFIYDSGIVEYLSDNFPEATIVLFGSYSFGEDTITSDIDIAIIGSKERGVNLAKFDKIFERQISIYFCKNLDEVNKNLRENIVSGIVLKGGIQL
ncbi:hypothetical protein A3K63_03235 [Candidatus Micrarchaeota archaeon RBG_16_49_10]|nr:MAG: hypothetical protein A3K63_03235 [Candidatus Micrarchaeota archaeon RBG_16_49_10]